MLRTLGVFALGLLAGAGLTWMLRGTTGHGDRPPDRIANYEPPQDMSARRAESAPVPNAESPGLHGAPAGAPPAAPPAPTRDGASAAPPVGPATREALIAARAEALRQQAEATVESARQLEANAWSVATQQIDSELARELARRADLERGGALDLVRRLGEDWVAPAALLASQEDFGRFFVPRQTGGHVGIVRANQSPVEIAHGDVVQVPSGAWPLDVRALTRATRAAGFPHDLTFEGAGMDRSLLVLNQEFDVAHDVVNLTFRDLTVNCNDNYFVQFRSGFTLRLERCRVIGFDMGAGGSTAFRGDQGALYATDARIEAGFGRSPWRGNLWRIQGPFLARLERCVIVGPIGDVAPRRRSLVVYDHVTFVDLDQREERSLNQNAETVRLLDCRFQRTPGYTQQELGQREERRVSELNLAWAPADGRR